MPDDPSPGRARTHSYWKQTVQNRMLLVVLGMVMLVPLLAWPSIPSLQTLADRAILVMAALLAGILVLRARQDFAQAELLQFLRTGPNTAILLYYLYSLLQVTFGLRDPALRHAGAFELERILTGGLLYFTLAYHIRRSEHLAKIRDTLVLVTGVMAIIGIVALVAQGLGSRSVLSGNSPFFGAFLMILLPIPLIQALTERDARRQNVAQTVAIVSGVCLLLSGTNTTWLGMLSSIALLGLLGRIGLPARQSALVNRRKYLLPLLVMLVCGGVYMAVGGPGRLLSGLSSAEQKREVALYRHKMLHTAELLFLRKPLFGQGLGAYPILQGTYTGNGPSVHDTVQNGPTQEEMAPSFWLQMATEQGVVGIGLFLAIVVSFLVAGVRRLRFMEAGLRRWLLLACLAGMGGFVIDALGNSVWQFAQVSMFFWLILGLGTACLRPRTAR